jgi:hypothetical protein
MSGAVTGGGGHRLRAMKKSKIRFRFTTSSGKSDVVSGRTQYCHLGLKNMVLRRGGLPAHPSPSALTTLYKSYKERLVYHYETNI